MVNKMAYTKLTPEQMNLNMIEVRELFEQKIISDDDFDKATILIGQWLRDNVLKVGYKRMCRLLIEMYKNSLTEAENSRTPRAKAGSGVQTLRSKNRMTAGLDEPA
jgi:hypothetical protein